MTLQIGQAIGRGSRRALSTSGIVLMTLTVLYQLVFVASLNTMVAELIPESSQQGTLVLTLPIPAAAAGVLGFVAFLAGTYLFVVSTRVLTRDLDEMSSVPSKLFTRRAGRAMVSAIGANIVVSVAVSVGFVLLFVPGLFLSVSFTFVVFAIGVEDERAIDSLRRSWELATGNRWRILGLVLIVGAIAGFVGGASSLLSIAAPVIGQVVMLVIIGILSIINYGIIADAFLQIRDLTESEPSVQ